MATATKSKTKATTKAPKAVEPEVEDTELEELDEDEATETPAKSGSGDEVTFGASDLAKHLSKGRDKAVTAREIRTLIRKMARDGSGRVTREITAGNRTRYNWSGVDDPEVQSIIEAFNNGELEADKQEKLAALKAKKAEKDAAKKAEKEKAERIAAKKAKAAAKAAETEDDDEDLEDDE